MRPSITALLALIRSSLRTRAELEAEILALRHQLAVLQQTAPRRLRLSQADRLLWVLLSRVWSRWRDAVQIMKPATVVSWHRRLFAWHWRWRSACEAFASGLVTSRITRPVRSRRCSNFNSHWDIPRSRRTQVRKRNRGQIFIRFHLP